MDENDIERLLVVVPEASTNAEFLEQESRTEEEARGQETAGDKKDPPQKNLQ